MAYDTQLAERIRGVLSRLSISAVEEKKMFRGLTFMVNGKMCISVSGENLMCRFDPALQDTDAGKKGFTPMIMKGREYKGYGYVSPEGIKSTADFDYWVHLCLDYNAKAKSSKNKKNTNGRPTRKK